MEGPTRLYSRVVCVTLSVVVNEDEKLQQIGQLGHELRNALTSVLAAAEIVKRRCGSAAESEHEVITRQVARMRKLVDEMLVLSGREQASER